MNSQIRMSCSNSSTMPFSSMIEPFSNDFSERKTREFLRYKPQNLLAEHYSSLIYVAPKSLLRPFSPFLLPKLSLRKFLSKVYFNAECCIEIMNFEVIWIQGTFFFVKIFFRICYMPLFKIILSEFVQKRWIHPKFVIKISIKGPVNRENTSTTEHFLTISRLEYTLIAEIILNWMKVKKVALLNSGSTL